MKSVLIIGLGRFGRHMAKKLIEQGDRVLAVDISEERADNAVNIIDNVQIGNAADEGFIETLGVENFDLCVVAIGDNFQTALEITVLLKDYGAKHILARASREVHKKLLLRNGADHVVYAEKEMAERLAVRYGANNLFDYIELTDDVGIFEIGVPENWIGKTIVEKSVRNRYNVSILATKINDTIYPLPSPDHMFLENETLLILADRKSIKSLIK